jgi:hypothetical protein
MEIESGLATETKPPKLRWYQYRLRSLFVLTTLVAIGCSWLAVMRQEQRKQGAAAKAIERAGGTVRSEGTWLGKLLRDDSLVRVTFVNLSGHSVTDDVLVHLEGLRQLYALDLSGTKVTDGGLVHLHGLRQLQTLELIGTQITDAGLVHLQGLSQLHELSLGDTQVTDAGLVHLHGLNQLQFLQLSGTQVTAEGLWKVQEALPNCHINRRFLD